MVLQVLLLMVFSTIYIHARLTRQPLRTIMNYQYRYGTPFATATRTLYHDGGVRRYYQGLTPALINGAAPPFSTNLNESH